MREHRDGGSGMQMSEKPLMPTADDWKAYRKSYRAAQRIEGQPHFDAES